MGPWRGVYPQNENVCAHAGSARGQPQLPDSSHKCVPAGGWPRWGTSTHTTHYAAEKGNHETLVSAEQSTEDNREGPRTARPRSQGDSDRGQSGGCGDGSARRRLWRLLHDHARFGHSPAWTRNRRSFPQVSHTSELRLKRRAGRNVCRGAPRGGCSAGAEAGLWARGKQTDRTHLDHGHLSTRCL